MNEETKETKSLWQMWLFLALLVVTCINLSCFFVSTIVINLNHYKELLTAHQANEPLYFLGFAYVFYEATKVAYHLMAREMRSHNNG